MNRSSSLRATCALVLGLATSCTGVADVDPARGRTSSASLESPGLLGEAGIRRLTQHELTQVIRDVFGVDVEPSDMSGLPPDLADEENAMNPFVNNYEHQFPSSALVAGLDFLGTRVASHLAADPAAQDALVGCRPASVDDEACFRSFIERVGRRAIRRPLLPEEVNELSGLLGHARVAGDFGVAVRLAVRVFVQHPELVYRVEVGTPVVAGEPLHRLGPYEVASRLSFLLWGTTPDDVLLDEARDGLLASEGGVRRAALRMLRDPRAGTQVATFHAQWMRYDQPAEPGSLEEDFRLETDMLVRRVTLDEASDWMNIFRSDESFLTPRLAEHYGLPAIAEPGWVSSGPERGGGILSHASFLSVDPGPGDTSPTFRGRNVLRRLICDESLPLPMIEGVDVDLPPGDLDACKLERWSMRSTPGCSSCHARMDDVGFGLENFDERGRYRTFEPSSGCEIPGWGEIDGMTFQGPRELGEAITSMPELDACAVRQLYRFAMGRSDRPEDQPALDAMRRTLRREGDFVGLLLEIVGSPAFLHRMPDDAPSASCSP